MHKMFVLDWLRQVGVGVHEWTTLLEVRISQEYGNKLPALLEEGSLTKTFGVSGDINEAVLLSTYRLFCYLVFPSRKIHIGKLGSA